MTVNNWLFRRDLIFSTTGIDLTAGTVAITTLSESLSISVEPIISEIKLAKKTLFSSIFPISSMTKISVVPQPSWIDWSKLSNDDVSTEYFPTLCSDVLHVALNLELWWKNWWLDSIEVKILTYSFLARIPRILASIETKSNPIRFPRLFRISSV